MRFMWALWAVVASGHVPQYGCEHGCCHAEHHHGTSQVAYLKNSGGIEFDLDALTVEGEGEIVDFDFVFKKEYDPSTGDFYYLNTRTGETLWDPPASHLLGEEASTDIELDEDSNLLLQVSLLVLHVSYPT